MESFHLTLRLPSPSADRLVLGPRLRTTASRRLCAKVGGGAVASASQTSRGTVVVDADEVRDNLASGLSRRSADDTKESASQRNEAAQNEDAKNEATDNSKSKESVAQPKKKLRGKPRGRQILKSEVGSVRGAWEEERNGLHHGKSSQGGVQLNQSATDTSAVHAASVIVDADRATTVGDRDSSAGGSDTSVSVPSAAEHCSATEAVTEDKGEGEEELEAGFKMMRVCDRLIDVFWVEKTTADDWRKLLGFSEEWAKIRPHFFRRCDARAKEMQARDPGKAAELFRLARKLKEVDDAMTSHDELLNLILENEEELDGIVARRRQDFTGEFFEHLRVKCQAGHRDFNKQEELVQLANKILNSVEQHDKLMQNEEAVEVAQAKFDDIMGSVTLEEACRKIDSLAERRQLDSPLMLMITKAWAAAKESNMMKDEVKDVMHHLYLQALSNMRMLVPKEVRILRHVLSLEDPREMMAALTAAFSPGDELQVQNAQQDYLYTTPDKLIAVMDQVLQAYYNNRQTTLIEEAKKLMSPAVIQKLEILKKLVVDEFK